MGNLYWLYIDKRDHLFRRRTLICCRVSPPSEFQFGCDSRKQRCAVWRAPSRSCPDHLYSTLSTLPHIAFASLHNTCLCSLIIGVHCPSVSLRRTRIVYPSSKFIESFSDTAFAVPDKRFSRSFFYANENSAARSPQKFTGILFRNLENHSKDYLAHFPLVKYCNWNGRKFIETSEVLGVN